MGDDNRWRDDHSGDWGDRFRRHPDDRRFYGADDFEQGPSDTAYGRPRGWPTYDPGRGSPAYRDASGARGWDRAADQGYGPRGSERFGGRYGRPGWESRGDGERDAWDRIRGEGRSFIDRTREELSSFFGGGRDEDRRDAEAGSYRGHGPRGYRRSDERIREDINDRLTEDHWLDASEIEVEVAAGEVTLSGTVRARADKRRAEDIAERVSGVGHVQNNLRARPEDPRPDDTVVLPMV